MYKQNVNWISANAALIFSLSLPLSARDNCENFSSWLRKRVSTLAHKIRQCLQNNVQTTEEPFVIRSPLYFSARNQIQTKHNTHITCDVVPSGPGVCRILVRIFGKLIIAALNDVWMATHVLTQWEEAFSIHLHHKNKPLNGHRKTMNNGERHRPNSWDLCFDANAVVHESISVS